MVKEESQEIIEEIVDEYSERFDNTVKPGKDGSIVDDYQEDWL